MLKFLVIFLLFFVVCISIRAATGCVRNSDPTTNYTTFVSPNYRHNGTIVTLGVGCTWNFISPSTACTISGGGASAGLLAVDNPQFCPIDD